MVMRHVAVIGLGNFGRTVAKSLTEKGAYVIAIDQNAERIEEIKSSVSLAVALNAIDKNALKSVNIDEVDVAIVCFGEDVEANILTTFLLKKMGVKKIWARAINSLQQEILKTMEIDQVINLEAEMGKIVASSLVSTNLMKHIPLSPGHSIAEVKIPAGFIGKTIRQIKPRDNFNVNIVAIKKKVPAINDAGERIFEEYVEDVPPPDIPFEEEDILLVVGSDENIRKISDK
ncbi:MAG: TrkA family potassium uptake protein [Candidatus Omnitrophota bacterium]